MGWRNQLVVVLHCLRGQDLWKMVLKKGHQGLDQSKRHITVQHVLKSSLECFHLVSETPSKCWMCPWWGLRRRFLDAQELEVHLCDHREELFRRKQQLQTLKNEEKNALAQISRSKCTILTLENELKKIERDLLARQMSMNEQASTQINMVLWNNFKTLYLITCRNPRSAASILNWNDCRIVGTLRKGKCLIWKSLSWQLR